MKLKKFEIILLLLLALGLSLWAFWPKAKGNTVTVTVDGEAVTALDLNENAQYFVDGYGEFSLTVVVENGEARVENSTCPDLICQNHSPIHSTGEEIVCLPGRVVVGITGEEAAVDAFVG